MFKPALILLLIITALIPAQASASAEAVQLNLNVVWTILAATLVFLMQAGFALIAWHYYHRFGYTTPLQTAAIFLGVVMGLDLLLLAPVFVGSYAMFQSTLGTWLPFALIFTATNVTGQLVTTGQA